MKEIVQFCWLLVSCSCLWLGPMASAQPHHIPPMDDMDFEGLLTELDAEFSEGARLKKAQSMLDQYHLTVAQMGEVMEQFAIKGNQELLAKEAYTNVVDPENYFQLYNALTFEDSRNTLRNWINEQPRRNDQPYYTTGPMSTAEFQQAYNGLEEEPFDEARMRIAEQLIDHHYLTTAQVHQLVESFSFKSNQEALARAAYPKTYDQQNYLQVLEACTFSSSKRSLCQWLQGQSVLNRSGANGPRLGTWQATNGNEEDLVIGYQAMGRGGEDDNDILPPTQVKQPVNPLILSDNAFDQLQAQLDQIANDMDRFTHIQQLSDETSWTAAQVREMMDALVFESMRLNVAMHAYPHTLDKDQYTVVYDGLKRPEDQQHLMDHIQQLDGNSSHTRALFNYHQQRLQPTTPPTGTGATNPPSSNAAAEWTTALDELRVYSSDNDRLNAAKNLADRRLLTTPQVLDVLDLLIFDDVKLDWAQYMYTRVVDPQAYSSVVNALSNERDQKTLQDYMDQQGR